MDKRTNNILVPVDFSEQSIITLDQAYNIARLAESEITILNVITTSTPVWSLFNDKEKLEIESRLASKLQNLADEVILKTGLKVNTIMEKGKVADTILHVAERINARFIIIGTTPASELKNKISGTFASRIVREARCPVISIKGKMHRNGCDNILLPLDMTSTSIQKVSMAIWLGKYFRSVIHAVTATSAKDPVVISKLEEQLMEVKSEIDAAGISCTTKMIQPGSGSNEKITEALLQYADEVTADLIMIMTQQEKEVKKFFIGSLATELMNKSEIPVMSCIPAN